MLHLRFAFQLAGGKCQLHAEGAKVCWNERRGELQKLSGFKAAMDID